jgi:hypothetical protein
MEARDGGQFFETPTGRRMRPGRKVVPDRSHRSRWHGQARDHQPALQGVELPLRKWLTKKSMELLSWVVNITHIW